MFFKLSKFKALLKAAYRGAGLTVINQGDKLVITSGWWCIWARKDAMQKEEKAALIELIGDLPETGEGFTALHDHENQYEIVERDDWNEDAYRYEEKEELDPLPALIETSRKVVRVLSGEERSIAIDEDLIELIDKQSVIPNKETEVEGPFLCRENDVLWLNNTCTLLVCRVNMGEENDKVASIFKALDKIE